MSGITIDLTNKVVLICGAGAGGIGSATADVFAEAGATIIAVDRSDQLVEETLASIRKIGANGVGIKADLMNIEETEEIIRRVRKQFDVLHAVVNVAGGTREHQWMELERTPNEIYREVFALNLDYVFRVCRDAAKFMIEKKISGSLTNISSMSSMASAPFHGPYGAAKAGVTALTRTMAAEWAEYGIRANSILPGNVPTPRVLSHRSTTDVLDVYPKTGRRGLVAPREIATAALFLTSDLSSGVTGQSLVVDIGITNVLGAANVDRMRAMIVR
jgi:NAD(P)-dependent dehydrogenase (short-subunit alcohol dehydrogenase family)